MPSRRFDQARPFAALAFFVLAWLILPTALKRFARISFYEFQAPLSVSASYARDLQNFWSLRTRSKNELINGYRELAGVTAQYSRAAD